MSDLRIDADLVRRLVADQFPRWSDLPVVAVVPGGHDNRTFRLGTELSVRLPSAERYAAHVAHEQRWLPHLARGLRSEIPEPVGAGRPQYGYPWLWTVLRWIQGETLSREDAPDLHGVAKDLAHWLRDLHALDTRGGPDPGAHNFHRGGDLAVYEAQARRGIAALEDGAQGRAAHRIWELARRSGPARSTVWVHGDLAPDNVLLRGDRLAAVIDFGQLAVGDPACDLTMAWTTFDAESAAVFRRELGLDRATWHRARGWALWKALIELRGQVSARRVDAARRTLARIVDDD